MSVDYKVLPPNPEWAEKFDVYMWNGYSLPSFAVKYLKENVETFEVRDDDVYIASHPKTGTTWVSQVIYLINSGLNIKEAYANTHFPYLEHRTTDLKSVDSMPSPRHIKTHFPLSLMPNTLHNKKCKIIYITRNPKDVAVSYYHFACMLKETGYTGTFEQFLERFLRGRSTYGPFWKHNLEFWNHRNDDNILFLFYEDLKQNLAGAVKKIAEFLGKKITEEEVKEILSLCTFESMAQSSVFQLEKSSVLPGKERGKFYRKGEVGDWQNYFSDDMNKKTDEWISEHFEESGLKFTYK